MGYREKFFRYKVREIILPHQSGWGGGGGQCPSPLYKNKQPVLPIFTIGHSSFSPAYLQHEHPGKAVVLHLQYSTMYIAEVSVRYSSKTAHMFI